MALAKGKFSDIPPDAVILSEREALEYETKILKNWDKPMDVFAFKYGAYILGLGSFISGMFLNTYYRDKFRLFNYGKITSYLPICVIPTSLSLITHSEFVLRDIVLQKRNTCPVCLEFRAASLQSIVGCVLPMILAPLSSMALSHKYATYDIPFITQEPKKVWQLIKKMHRPIANIALAILIAQAFLASTVTYYEYKSVYMVNLKLSKLEGGLIMQESF